MVFARASAEGKQGLYKLIASLSGGEKISTTTIDAVVKGFSAEPEGFLLNESLNKMFLQMRKNHRNESQVIWEAAFGPADVPHFSAGGCPFQAWALSHDGHDFLVLNSEVVGNNIEFMVEQKNINWVRDFLGDVNKLLEDGVELAAHRRKKFLEMDLRQTAGNVSEKVSLKI